MRLLEASDGVGGRVRTDEVDGFLLDRGFQVRKASASDGRRGGGGGAQSLRCDGVSHQTGTEHGVTEVSYLQDQQQTKGTLSCSCSLGIARLSTL